MFGAGAGTLKKVDSGRFGLADILNVLFFPISVRAPVKDVAPNLTLQTFPLLNRDSRPALLKGEIDLAIGSFPGIVA